jgi:hypothetical protein
MRRREFSLDVRSANETGDPSNVADLVDLVVQVGPASFTATVQIEASLDGTNYNDLGSPFVDAGGLLEITAAYRTIRAKTTLYSAGALVGRGAGRDSRTDC